MKLVDNVEMKQMLAKIRISFNSPKEKKPFNKYDIRLPWFCSCHGNIKINNFVYGKLRYNYKNSKREPFS